MKTLLLTVKYELGDKPLRGIAGHNASCLACGNAILSDAMCHIVYIDGEDWCVCDECWRDARVR